MSDTPECCRRSFAASIKDTARRLLEDPTVAPRKVASDRLTICESCDHYTAQKTCELCQCYMPLKTTMANMKCPLDKWTEWHRGD
jgi:recombinational DNA repair protein RecR